jgi:hypothetical protein
MKPKVVYTIVIVVAVGAAVGVWALYRSPNNANFPEGTHWICRDPSCGTQVTLTMKQLGEHNQQHFGKLPFCPKCNKEMLRADICRHCGKWYPQMRENYFCPYCKQENRPDAT